MLTPLSTVLVTGGTRGIGLAIALELTRHGARVCVTHRWGSVSIEDLNALFGERGLRPPRVEECDASDRTQTRLLLERLYADWGQLDAVVSNVAFGANASKLDDLNRSSLEIALSYTCWPLLDLIQLSLCYPKPPKRFVAISSPGVEYVYAGYDMLAVGKAGLETLVRYLAYRVRTSGIVINAVRLGCIDTESLRIFLPEASKGKSPHLLMDPLVGARAVVALLTGLLDGMTGQVITVDEGATLVCHQRTE